jgi:hypothetical protein
VNMKGMAVGETTPARRNILTITVKEDASEQRWILHGRLTDYSIAEVLSNWYVSQENSAAVHRVIDLDGVSDIDSSGKRALSMMIHDGATFGGQYARYLVAALQACARDNSCLD